MANQATAFFRDGRAYPSQAQLNAAVDDLADLLAAGLDLNDASDRMGVTRGTGCSLFRSMCERLGAQAR